MGGTTKQSRTAITLRASASPRETALDPSRNASIYNHSCCTATRRNHGLRNKGRGRPVGGNGLGNNRGDAKKAVWMRGCTGDFAGLLDRAGLRGCSRRCGRRFWHPVRGAFGAAVRTGGLRFAATPGYFLATLRVAPGCAGPETHLARCRVGVSGHNGLAQATVPLSMCAGVAVRGAGNVGCETRVARRKVPGENNGSVARKGV